GLGTFYSVGLGACGVDSTNADYVVAVSSLVFNAEPGYSGSDPNTNPLCNQQITATYQGNSVTVTIVDSCSGCADWDLNFSPTAFEQLAPLSVGRIHGMTWVILG
ncbi:RlpA-like double-psi beta-barrel-protein domain-containing protein-containing protein, partial [Fomitopsis serialis]|uniref:RlpA-like double-psi beta-barrel-protein domain-containing protein-containing protein n=1 Tax=Fomitopsis serialis TaxID=139415 RepID=UPI002007F8B8